MGAWGAGPFDNDDAGDWIFELEETQDLSAVESALERVAHADGYLDAPDCSSAIAAAEVVAALRGKPLPALPEDVRTWLAGRTPPPAATIALALQAIAAIQAGSELRDLWEESGSHEDWLATLRDLEARLR